MSSSKSPKTSSVIALLQELKRQTNDGCCLAPLYGGMLSPESLTFCKYTAKEKEHPRCQFLIELVEQLPSRAKFNANRILSGIGRAEDADREDENGDRPESPA